MSYAVFFDKNNETIRLPVNPETINITKGQVVETYNVLKLGQISKAGASKLDEYTFEAELPGKPYWYVVTAGEFKPADYYINKFDEWRKAKEPVRFIKNNGEGDDISTLVIIESFDISEHAGEEGDYYTSFKLVEYKPFGKREVYVNTEATTAEQVLIPQNKDSSRDGEAPKPNTHRVVKGEVLWGIAKRYLGNGARYPEIVAINPKIKNPGLIYIGQVINIP